MVFDDHDVHDDWNTSQKWVDDIRGDGLVGRAHRRRLLDLLALPAHGQPVAPAPGRRRALRVSCARPTTAGRCWREFAFRADREVQGTRWSYCRDFGRTRLIMIDSRAGRVLEPPGSRSMLDPHEWEWLEQHAEGDFDHLLIGTSLPFLLAPGLHYLEAWNEAVCNGAWGPAAAWPGSRCARGWTSSTGRRSARRWTASWRSCARSERASDAPASIVALSGDVHHAYLAEVGFPRGTGMRSAVYQATCSPFRNPLDGHERQRDPLRLGPRRARSSARLLARSAGVGDPPVRWRFAHDAPFFDNQVCFLELEGRRARLWLQKTVPEESDGYSLETVFEQRAGLTSGQQRPRRSARGRRAARSRRTPRGRSRRSCV